MNTAQIMHHVSTFLPGTLANPSRKPAWLLEQEKPGPVTIIKPQAK